MFIKIKINLFNKESISIIRRKASEANMSTSAYINREMAHLIALSSYDDELFGALQMFNGFIEQQPVKFEINMTIDEREKDEVYKIKPEKIMFNGMYECKILVYLSDNKIRVNARFNSIKKNLRQSLSVKLNNNKNSKFKLIEGSKHTALEFSSKVNDIIESIDSERIYYLIVELYHLIF